jgi:hypothetical protein
MKRDPHFRYFNISVYRHIPITAVVTFPQRLQDIYHMIYIKITELDCCQNKKKQSKNDVLYVYPYEAM